MSRLFIPVAISVVVIFMGISGGCSKNSNQSANAVKGKVPVKVQDISLQDLTETVILVGTVEPVSEATIFPKIAGRIESLSVDKGQKVHSSDKLAVLEHSAITAQREQAEATLKVYQAQLKQVEKERTRIKSLAQVGAASLQNLDQIETQYELVNAQIEQTEALLRQAKIQEKEAYLVAPIDGIIAERFLEIGDMANPSQPIFRIVQIDNVKIISALPEEEISRVQEGNTEAEIRVDTYPEERFQGKVTKIAPTLDPKNRTVEIEISLPNPVRSKAPEATAPDEHRGTSNGANPELKLKPGMFSRIKLVLEVHHDIVAVPRELLIREGDNYWVYVAQDNYARKREVTLGAQAKGLVEISKGLAPDEKIITTLGTQIYDGCEIVY